MVGCLGPVTRKVGDVEVDSRSRAVLEGDAKRCTKFQSQYRIDIAFIISFYQTDLEH